jgi:integrase
VPELNPPPNRLVNKEQAPRRALSDTERDRVLAAMRANGDARAARIWTVMAYAGLRRGEAARLTLRALDRHAGVLHVFGKSGEHETVPLHPEVSRAVRAEAAANGVRDRDVPVFGGFDLRKAWKRAIRRARVDAFGTTAHHTARHTFGTIVAQLSRGDVTAVQSAMRHRSLAMTSRYVHADAARARAVVKKM